MTPYQASIDGRDATAFGKREADHIAVLIMIGLLWFGLLAGFLPDSLEKLGKDRSFPLVIHAHAVLAVGWMALLTWQALQATRGRIVAHRRTGRIGQWMGLALVIVSVPAAFVSDMIHRHDPGFVASRLALQYVHLLVFAVLTLAAFLNVSRPDAHKRLLLMGVIALVDAGFSRWVGDGVVSLLGPGPLGQWAMRYPLSIGLLALMGLYDLKSRGRLHPVFLPAALLIAGSQVFTLWLYFWPPFRALSARLLGLA